jgi:ABC-type multidrug transport system ATPase subunit
MEQICDDVAILNKGELLYSGSLSKILESNKTLEDYFYKLINPTHS